MSIFQIRSAAIMDETSSSSSSSSSLKGSIAASACRDGGSDATKRIGGDGGDGDSSAGTRSSRVGRRRRWKSALCLAAATTATVVLRLPASVDAFSPAGTRNGNDNRQHPSERRAEWNEQSVQYYSSVLRMNPSTEQQPKQKISKNVVVDRRFVELAAEHYLARSLIKQGKWTVAEKIYRRLTKQLTNEIESGEDCDHAKLAMSTLLLALHVQRTGDKPAARAVFMEFFTMVQRGEESGCLTFEGCTCSAKVLQAYALFEMKCGRAAESLTILRKAIEMDEAVRPVLQWKQFRDASNAALAC